MKIASVNIGPKRQVEWKGKLVETGIFKYPVETSIFLGLTDVRDDVVVDRRYHGGIDKACYAYSTEHYSFWQKRFREVDMTFGAFGENLSIESLDENKIHIGDQYKIGEDVIVEVAQPRQPCMKLGIRFNDQKVVKQFINEEFSGVYFRVIKEGLVNTGDELVLLNREENNLTVTEVHTLMSSNKNLTLAKSAILMDKLAEAYKADIKRVYHL